ncbi:MAG: tRNA (adenosine(37)-N6)-dimethylallyltransferase MiaA [Oscillospiraceae bacterium]|nr:tRNA (adenosine(37)-N6)-dimethylallyltransferase MiaA [Oscillospiraceae bacterium]
MKSNKRVIVITGPTASGKTALGVEISLRLNGEVISADSMQLYKGMDIGTAKVRPDEMRSVPHHMIDVASPEESYSVSRWVSEAAVLCEDIFARGHIPVIVGGTGLYIDSLLSGRDFSAREENGETRARLSALYDEIGGEAFRQKLIEVDPERGEKLAAADKKRLVRALEVFELTGKTISEHDAETKLIPPRYESLRFALCFEDREKLYERIDKRVDIMMAEGLAGEVAGLIDSGLSEQSTALQAIGYKEIVAAMGGQCTLAEAVDEIKRGSRRYAKRQLTWIRRDEGINWIKWGETPDINKAADYIEALWKKGETK